MIRPLFKKTYTSMAEKPHNKEEEPSVPVGLWRKCNKCGHPIYVDDVKANLYICPKCDGYFRIHARKRIQLLTDKGSFEEWNEKLPFTNPLGFPGYEKKVAAAREKTGLDEAIVTGRGTIMGEPTAIGVCDARFLMASMGHNVGEKITRMVERATEEKLPVIIYACSGGARMQEGLVSLMQMAKTSAALQKHHEAGQLFISVLTDPTTGGVTASFAMLGDIILAEPGALIGFAGPRVIEQTIGQKLPEGFQKAEFLLEHGFVDKIVERHEQREVIAQILKLHRQDVRKANPQSMGDPGGIQDSKKQSEALSGKKVRAERRSAWDIVTLSRKVDRPVAMDYIHAVFDHFIEFHGDRYFGDDGAVVGGIAEFSGIPVTVIGQQKGRSTKENIKRNFGMPSPEGYRKALRLMKQAETFHRPVVCFVDTPGAFCGLDAEERGQGEAIARNLFEMAALTVPVLSIVIGEGGSGGALALAVANQVWILENAVYSVLSPEGFASILWKDSKRAYDAARVMRITGMDLYEKGLVERIIWEEEPASAKTLPVLAAQISQGISDFLEHYRGMGAEAVREERYARFRRF